MKELKETVALMNSADYKERFIAEYHQNETRYLKLKAMIEKWDKGELNFTPTCPRKIYDRQLSAMLANLFVLVERANMENIELVVDDKMHKIFDAQTNNQVIISKQIRMDVDDILRRVHNMQSCREVSIVITKLQEAIMWMGMNLKRLNEPDPYPESKNPESMRIEPTADGLRM